MQADRFRALALALPGVIEGSHHRHPDFRVGGRIFATLLPDGRTGMVRLTPAAQAEWMAAEPLVFRPASGAWGRSGATLVELERAQVASAKRALRQAFELRAAEQHRRTRR